MSVAPRSADRPVEGGIAVTVDGPVPVAELGVTSIHEHLSADLRCYAVPPRTERQRRIAHRPVSTEILGDIRRDLCAFPDALVLKDHDLVATELSEFAALGGRTVVELSSKGLRPDPEAVRWVARRAGVNVVMGCGHYVAQAHLPEVATSSVDQLATAMLDDISGGLDGTDVRPGVIGEIGTGQPVHPREWKVLDAACLAQRESGLCLFVHVESPGHTAPEVIEYVLEAGVPPERLNVCHLDGRTDLGYLRRVAGYGVYMSFDTFGLEVYYDSFDYGRSQHDGQRVRTVLALIDDGWLPQLVIGQDVCTKIQLRPYGGYGYGHVLRHIVPQLKFEGLDDDVIDQLLVRNPSRALASHGAASASPLG